MTEFSVVDPAGVLIGEHPLWDADGSRVGWVDILGGVLRWVSDGQVDSWQFPAPIGAAALRRSGGVIAATGEGIHFRDASGQADREPLEVALPDGVRFNDVGCDPDGYFLCGTMALDGRAGLGSLYRISPDGEIEVLEAPVSESNGLAWSLDGETLYYVDSFEPAVRRYAYASDRPLQRLDDLCAVEQGIPDGICVDATGAIWVALWEGSALWRVSPLGELLQTVTTPVSRPSCPAFGGPKLDRLYVSSAREGLDQAGLRAEPWAGHLLVCDPQATGVSAHAYAG